MRVSARLAKPYPEVEALIRGWLEEDGPYLGRYESGVFELEDDVRGPDGGLSTTVIRGKIASAGSETAFDAEVSLTFGFKVMIAAWVATLVGGALFLTWAVLFTDKGKWQGIPIMLAMSGLAPATGVHSLRAGAADLRRRLGLH